MGQITSFVYLDLFWGQVIVEFGLGFQRTIVMLRSSHLGSIGNRYRRGKMITLPGILCLGKADVLADFLLVRFGKGMGLLFLIGFSPCSQNNFHTEITLFREN